MAGPARTEFWAALEIVKVNAGVVVALATDVVKRGERAPALKLVTEPPPPLMLALPTIFQSVPTVDAGALF